MRVLFAVLWVLVCCIIPVFGATVALERTKRRGGTDRLIPAAGIPIVAMIWMLVAYWPLPDWEPAAEHARLRLLLVAFNTAPAIAAAIVVAYTRWRPAVLASLAWLAIWAVVVWRQHALAFVIPNIFLALGIIAWNLLLVGATQLRRRYQLP